MITVRASESVMLTKFGEWIHESMGGEKLEAWSMENSPHSFAVKENRDMGGNWLRKWTQSVFIS